ncbi:NAC domain-containing protein 82-like [Neltuma alba]|uniref:NAC domain-containing protein 82-like n=1 Tax=Neltuma alba TaxID=207710 RepID=UPI0010A3F58A|nr:NAC domain-containing protein 82-like [Prosopis alba]
MTKTKKLIPGFRFHPTDVELVQYFLKRKVIGKKFPVEVIAEVDIYKYAPWDLPDKSLLSTEDLEWYFFCPRAKKYAIGGRMNRSTEVGYWKTTGRDKPIWHNNQTVGMMKTLVFHMGRPPKGRRTDWVMHEFRLDQDLAHKGIAQDSYVLCRVCKKDGPGPRNGGQYGKLFDEENWDDEEDKTDGVCSISIAKPLPILPIAHNHNNNNFSPCGRNWSIPKSTLSSGATNPSPVNTDVSCSLDYFAEEEYSTLLLALNGSNNMETDVNSEEKKESEGIAFDEIFGDLEDLINMAAFDEDDDRLPSCFPKSYISYKPK